MNRIECTSFNDGLVAKFMILDPTIEIICGINTDTDVHINGMIRSIEKVKNEFEPKKVIFNDPRTIVYWTDGTKTIVKAIDEPFDKEKGLAMAICKKAMGNKGNYNNVFKKWIPEVIETKE